MQKMLFNIVLAALCLFFKANAQDNKAIDVTTKGIQIGQQVPDIALTGLHNYKDKNGRPAATARLSDFRGQLLILDFWATWCSPCMAMIPKMDSLQKQFGNKIRFLSVTYQTPAEVLPFMQKYEKQKGRHYELPMLIGDSLLSKTFPYKTLPHYVWLDNTGKVLYITSSREVTQENITSVLSGKSKLLDRKQDFTIAYDPEKPLFNGGNGGGGESMVYHSVLTGYTPGLGASFNFKRAAGIRGARITLLNVPVKNLFAFVYARGQTVFNDKRIAILSRDSMLMTRPKDAKPLEWQAKNSYCYELIVPDPLKNELFNVAVNDLERLFPQYQASVKPQAQMCMVLVRTSETDKMKSKGGSPVADFNPFGFKLQNFPLARLTAQLNVIYMQKSPFWISDETGYTGPVDIAVSADLSSFDALNKALEPYGLKYVQKSIMVDKLIIDDKN